MGLDQLCPYMSGLPLLCALAGLGWAIGILTGLFGVGGGFLITPVLIVAFGIDESLAVGSSLSLMIGTGAAGLARHARLGNVEPKSMLILGGGSVGGAILGTELHVFLRTSLGLAGPVDFHVAMRGLYVVLLLATGWLVLRGSAERRGTRSLLQRLPLPPRVDLPHASLTGVSLFGMSLLGVCVGVLSGLLGVGGGVLFMPILLLVVGLSAHQAVGTSLGVVLFAAIAGTIKHGLLGTVNLWIAMACLMGSTIGVQLGAWLCHRLHAEKLRRYFALVVFAAAAVVAADLAGRLLGRP